jgi:hypothetical protein
MKYLPRSSRMEIPDCEIPIHDLKPTAMKIPKATMGWNDGFGGMALSPSGQAREEGGHPWLPALDVVWYWSADHVQDAGRHEHGAASRRVGQPHAAPQGRDGVRDPDADREPDAGLEGA